MQWTLDTPGRSSRKREYLARNSFQTHGFSRAILNDVIPPSFSRNAMSYLEKCRLLHASLLVLSVILIGCGPAPKDLTEITVSEALAFESLGWGLRANLDTTEVVIRTAEAWETYQATLHPLQPFSDVDFTQEMVLLAAVPVPTGGYTIAFEVVETANDTLTAQYLVSMPGIDCLTATGDAVVFQAVRLAKTEGAMRWEHTREAYRCTERGTGF